MAEQVQAALDRMVPALADLQERGVLTAQEIRATVARRRESEYLLRRHHPRKADFLQIYPTGNGPGAAAAVAGAAIAERSAGKQQEEQSATAIIATTTPNTWATATSSNTCTCCGCARCANTAPTWNLWKQYAAFCEETRSFRKLAQCHRDALRFHPHHVPFWIAAASSEYFQAGSSASNARVLLQRALRLHPAAPDLWLQSLVLELHFVQKLRGRRAVLRRRDDDVWRSRRNRTRIHASAAAL